MKSTEICVWLTIDCCNNTSWYYMPEKLVYFPLNGGKFVRKMHLQVEQHLFILSFVSWFWVFDTGL